MRKTTIAGHVYNVPRWVSRVDAEKQQRHGWQVRWVRNGKKECKFFVDTKFGGIKGAFDAAIAYAKTYNPGIRNRMSLDCGVRLVLIKNHLYAEASHPRHGIKRYYAGVDGLVLYSKIEKVLAKAEAQRIKWYAEHEKWLNSNLAADYK